MQVWNLRKRIFSSLRHQAEVRGQLRFESYLIGIHDELTSFSTVVFSSSRIPIRHVCKCITINHVSQCIPTSHMSQMYPNIPPRYKDTKILAPILGLSSEMGSQARCAPVEMKQADKYVRTPTENQKENIKSMYAHFLFSWRVVSLCLVYAVDSAFILCLFLPQNYLKRVVANKLFC